MPRRTATAKPPIFPIVVHVRGKAGCRPARQAGRLDGNTGEEQASEREGGRKREREHVELASDNRLN